MPETSARSLQVWTLEGIPEITPGTELATVIGEALASSAEGVEDGDIVVVTSKIVSKAEDRFIAAADRESAITAETVRVVATRRRADGGTTRIVRNRLGIIGAAAGVDASNTPEGTVLLLPEDPDSSARSLARRLRERFDLGIGVVITDTLGRPWREGQTDIAIGAAGVQVFDELLGAVDTAGRPLLVTRPCLAPEIGAAPDLVKGKTRGRPVAVVRGLAHLVGALDLPGATSIVRDDERDMFRLGSDEAHDEGYREGYAAGVAAGRAER